MSDLGFGVTKIDEFDEEHISNLLQQVQADMPPELADQFTNMIKQLREPGSLFMLPGHAVLGQIAIIFDFGRRYEAVVQNDMRAETGNV